MEEFVLSLFFIAAHRTCIGMGLATALFSPVISKRSLPIAILERPREQKMSRVRQLQESAHQPLNGLADSLLRVDVCYLAQLFIAT